MQGKNGENPLDEFSWEARSLYRATFLISLTMVTTFRGDFR